MDHVRVLQCRGAAGGSARRSRPGPWRGEMSFGDALLFCSRGGLEYRCYSWFELQTASCINFF